MKFEIYGKELGKMIDRISAVVAKKSYTISFECVKFICENGELCISATDIDNYATIKTDTRTYENGITWVLLSDLKQIVANDMLYMITSIDGKFEVRSDKKSYEFKCYDDFNDSFPDAPVLKDKDVVCRIADKEFVNYLSVLDCIPDISSPNASMKGFCLDFKEKKIVACDGHRLGIVNIDADAVMQGTKQAIILNTTYKHLKNLIGKSKTENNIEIFVDEEYVMFTGNDWTYTTRLIKATYFQYKNIMRCKEDYDYEYSVNAKEMCQNAKEYKSALSTELKPMLIYYNNGKLATGIQTTRCNTSDLIDSIVPEHGMDREIYGGFNPAYIMDACNAFNEDVHVRGKYNTKEPIIFTDGKYDMLVLPINIDDDNVSFVKKQVA